MNLKQTFEVARLLDTYGQLLTKKQQAILNSYVNFNGSISEIAEDTGISRQAVLDSIKRTVCKLENYEKKLGICEKMSKIYLKISELSKKFCLTSQQEKELVSTFKIMEE